jgi:hypothetical protein
LTGPDAENSAALRRFTAFIISPEITIKHIASA